MRFVTISIVLLAAAAGCVRNVKAMSAGRVGCSPDEIEISGEQRDYTGTHTWTATCHGAAYHCSRGEREVACSAAAGESAAPSQTSQAAAGPKSEFATSEPPRGAGGFDFKLGRDAGARLCTEHGKSWNAIDERLYECTGAVADLGFDASVRVAFCETEACEITLLAPARGSDASDWVSRYTDLRKALEQKYGEVRTLASSPNAESCDGDALKTCLLRGRIKAQALWRWRTGSSLELVMAKDPAKAEAMQIRLVYRDRGDGGPRLNAL